MSTIAMHVLLAALLAAPQESPARSARPAATAPARQAPTADRPAARPDRPGPVLQPRGPGMRPPIHPLAPGGILAGAGRVALPAGAVRTFTDRGAYVLPRGEHVMTPMPGLPGGPGDRDAPGRGVAARERVPVPALGAGDAHGVALYVTGDDGFSGPVDPPGPFVRPTCPTHGDSCAFFHPLFARNLAEGLPDAAPPVPLIVPRDPFAMRALERLGLYLRELRASEVLASTEGRQILEDTPASAAPDGTGVAQVAAARLERVAVLTVVERYEALFGPPEGDGDEPGAAPQIQAVLAQAWEAYARSRGPSAQAVEPGAFRAFLAGDGQRSEALAYVDGLRTIAGELAIMGLTPAEIRRTRSAVLAPLAPAGVSIAQLEEAMGIDGVG